MLISKLALALPLAVMIIAGCSSTDQRFQPVESPEVTNLFSVNKLWSKSTGGVDDYFSELELAFDKQNVYSASRDGKVKAFASSDGKELWSIDLSKQPENDERRSARLSGGVAFGNGLLALGSENGYVYVLKASDGSLVWKKYIEAEVVAKPAFNISADKLFVLDSKGNFNAFNALDGTTLWVGGDAPSSLRLRSQPTPLVIGDEYVLVGTSSGNVNVILQSNGSTVNAINIGERIGSNSLERIADVSASPLVLGNDLYAISFGGGLVRYDLATFNYIARLGYKSSHDLGFDYDSILITADDGTVYCLNRGDNSQRWANTQLAYRGVTSPVVYGDYAVVGDYEGYLYFLDLTDGSIDYKTEVDSSGVYVAPQVKNGNLYAVSRDGDLVCLNLNDSSVKQKELDINATLANAAYGLTLNYPGVYDSGIYAPNDISPEQLEARRAAIKKAVAQQEAQMEAQRRAMAEANRAREEYEKRRAEYEAEKRSRLSGFGIASGIRSEMKDSDLEQSLNSVYGSDSQDESTIEKSPETPETTNDTLEAVETSRVDAPETVESTVQTETSEIAESNSTN